MDEKGYKRTIIKRLTALNLYRPEFDPTIDRLATLYCECDKLDAQYIKTGGNPVIMYTNKAGASNPTKNPILSARDTVYSQLLEHERELGLTPAALKKINETSLKKKEVSGFASALAEALRGAGE